MRALYRTAIFLVAALSISALTERTAFADNESPPWVIGVKSDFEPMGYLEDGDRAGFEVDLAQSLVARLAAQSPGLLGRKGVEFKTVTTQDRFPMLDAGDVDLLIATASVTPIRELRYTFSDPYFYTRIGFVSRQAEPIGSVGSLQQRTVGGLKNSTTVNALSQIHGVTILLRDDLATLLGDLGAKRIDAIALDETFVPGVLKQLGADYGKSRLVIGSEAYAIAFRRNESQETVRAFNDAILSLKQDGTVREIAAKHKLAYPEKMRVTTE